MDRALDARFIARRRQALVLRAIAVVAMSALVLAVARDRLAASVRRGELVVATVDHGEVASSLEASGLVLPERESLLASPTDARVIALRRAPGDAVAPGDLIVELDPAAARLAFERLDRQAALKANGREQARLDLERALADIAADERTRELELRSHEQRAARDRKLGELGLAAAEDVLESQAMVERDRIGLERVRARRLEARRELEVRLEALDLEHAILVKERDESARLLEECQVRAREAGVLSWVVPTAGASVRRGDELARVAALSSFRVEATLSDVHAAVVHAGQRVEVILPGTRLAGVVSQVRPTVEEGTLRLDVALDEPAHPGLRHKLRVDVHVVTARREQTLRVRATSFAQPDGSEAAWVLRGNRVFKVPVRLGVRGLSHVEVAAGLAAGDSIILSDMSDYSNLMEVRVR